MNFEEDAKQDERMQEAAQSLNANAITHTLRQTGERGTTASQNTGAGRSKRQEEKKFPSPIAQMIAKDWHPTLSGLQNDETKVRTNKTPKTFRAFLTRRNRTGDPDEKKLESAEPAYTDTYVETQYEDSRVSASKMFETKVTAISGYEEYRPFPVAEGDEDLLLAVCKQIHEEAIPVVKASQRLYANNKVEFTIDMAIMIPYKGRKTYIPRPAFKKSNCSFDTALNEAYQSILASTYEDMQRIINDLEQHFKREDLTHHTEQLREALWDHLDLFFSNPRKPINWNLAKINIFREAMMQYMRIIQEDYQEQYKKYIRQYVAQEPAY